MLREVGEYLAGLPVGLRSFPTCEADGRLLGGLAAGGVERVPLQARHSTVLYGAALATIVDRLRQGMP